MTHRNYGFSAPKRPKQPPTCLIAAGAIITMTATLGYAIYLAMRMHGNV